MKTNIHFTLFKKAILIALLFFQFNLFSQNYVPDSNYNARLQGTVENSFLLNNGKTLVCGYLGNNFNSGFNNVVLLNSNGNVDSTFQCVISNGSSIFFAKTLKNGKIMIGGNFSSVNSVSKRTVAVLNSDGSLDQNFSLDASVFGNFYGYSMEYANDGQYFLTGNFSLDYNSVTNKYKFNTLVKVDSFGNLDTNFKTPYQVLSTQNSKIIKVRNNKFYLLGSFIHHNNGNIRGIVRLKADGSLDSGFMIKNYSNLNGSAYDMVELPDLSVVIAGQFLLGNLNAIAKFNDSGYLDSSFVYSLGFEKRYTGYYTQYCSYSYSCGSFFRPRTCYSSYPCGNVYYDYWGQGTVFTLSLLPNGNLFVGGDFGRFNGNLVENGVVIKPDGSIDYSMNTSFNNIVKTSIALNDNEILVGGLFSSSINSKNLGNFIKLKKHVKNCGTHLPIAMQAGIHNSSYSTTDIEGFKHFCSNNDELLLSIKIGNSGAVIPDNGVSLKIDTQLVDFHQNGTGFIANPEGFAMWNRSWDVNPSVQPTSPLEVKYYFNNAMVDSLNDNLTKRNLNPIDAIDSLYFFKVKNSSKGAHPLIDSLQLNDIELIKNGSISDINSWVLGQSHNHLFAQFKVNSFSGGGGGASPSGFSPLPVYDIEFNVFQNNEKVDLKWNCSNEEDILEYQILKSIDGKEWTILSQIKSKSSISLSSYVLQDLNPSLGVNFYQLQLINKSGNVVETLTQKVEFKKGLNFTFYPNPAKNTLNINSNQTIVSVEIFNYQGIMVYSSSNDNSVIDLNAIQNGAYIIKVIFDDNRTLFNHFIKQN